MESVVGIVAVVNFLYGAGWTISPIFPKCFSLLSPAQTRALDQFSKACSIFAQAPPALFNLAAERKEVVERRMGYGGEGVSVRRNLQADKRIAAWPKVGEGPVWAAMSMGRPH